MKKEIYVTPEVELVDIEVESCFAVSETSFTNDPSDLEYENW